MTHFHSNDLFKATSAERIGRLLRGSPSITLAADPSPATPRPAIRHGRPCGQILVFRRRGDAHWHLVVRANGLLVVASTLTEHRFEARAVAESICADANASRFRPGVAPLDTAAEEAAVEADGEAIIDLFGPLSPEQRLHLLRCDEATDFARRRSPSGSCA